MTNSNVWLTNVSAVLTNGAVSLSFGIAGGSNGVAYDVFATTALIGSYPSNSFWAWMGQGFQCNNYSINGLPTNSPCFLILGTPQDSDSDGLTDAFELLVSKTNPYQADTDGDGIPDGWQWAYFGSLQPADGDYDGDGVSNYQEYLNGTDPNKIQFSVSVTNQYSATNQLPAQLVVSKGVPSSAAVLIDSTNFTSATWTAFNSNLLVNLGTNEGWHDIWVGLRGLSGSSVQTWSWRRAKFDKTPPVLVITNPASSAGSWPMIQVLGFSVEPLSALSCDLSNSAGLFTNQMALVSDQYFDTNTFLFTTNFLQVYDVRLAAGTNVLMFHAADLAGNTTTTNFSFVLASNTVAPAITMNWPQNGMTVCGSTFTLDGWLDNPSAGMIASFVDTNGVTNNFTGIVERTGRFWVEDIPLTAGTNLVTLTACDAWSNSVVTNLTVVDSDLSLTVDALDPDSLNVQTITVTGTVSDASYGVWVNGIQATVNSGGTWSADSVPVNSGGTASFEAQAYPQGQSPATNTVSPVRLKYNTDKGPYIFVPSDSQNTSTTTNTVFTGPDSGSVNITDTQTQLWTDGSGGGEVINSVTVSTSGSIIQTNMCNQKIVWPATLWPNLVGGPRVVTGDCAGWLSTNGPSPNIGLEHCDVNDPKSTFIAAVPPSTASTKTDETYTRTAQTKLTLFTGGKADPNRRSFILLTAWANEILNKRAQPPYSSGAPGQGIPSTSIVLGELGALWADARLFKVLPDGVYPDITPTVSGKPFYNFGLYSPVKYVPVSTCHANTPADKTRTTIGVGEYVDLGFNPAMSVVIPKWTVSAGGLTYNSQTAPFAPSVMLTAPSNAASSTVTATIRGEKLDFNFNVLEPSGIDHATITSLDTFPIGSSAAGMWLNVFIKPTSVSFYRVQIMEIGQNASSISGYFLVNGAPSHIGHGADNPIQLAEDNSWPDHASSDVYSPPWTGSGWSGGGFTWVIPAVWWIGNGPTNSMTGWNQVYTLQGNGTVRIDKFGQWVSRNTSGN